MRTRFLPLLTFALLFPSFAAAQNFGTVTVTPFQPSTPHAATVGQTIHDGTVTQGFQWTPSNASVDAPVPARWLRPVSNTQPQTLAPMLTRAPNMASPVIAAPMIMSVRGPERYNYASPRGYSPARGGFIFGRRSRR